MKMHQALTLHLIKRLLHSLEEAEGMQNLLRYWESCQEEAPPHPLQAKAAKETPLRGPTPKFF